MTEQELKKETRYCWTKKDLDDLSKVLKSNSLNVETVITGARVPILLLRRKKQFYLLHVDTANVKAAFHDYKAVLYKGNNLSSMDSKLYEIAKRAYPHKFGLDLSVF